jgi:hypothetical protein
MKEAQLQSQSAALKGATNHKNLVSHREHRDHRGETNGYHEIANHLLRQQNMKISVSFSVFSVNSVA